jgi:hypothetical protein
LPESFRPVSNPQTQGHATDDLKHRFSNLANELLQFLEKGDAAVATASVIAPDSEIAAVTKIKNIIAARAARNRLFGNELFADPAWDILLDLTIARAESRRISVSSLCIAANVPTTTALRYIKMMTEKGLIVIIDDLNDGRRRNASLSANMYDAMLEFAISIP